MVRQQWAVTGHQDKSYQTSKQVTGNAHLCQNQLVPSQTAWVTFKVSLRYFNLERHLSTWNFYKKLQKSFILFIPAPQATILESENSEVAFWLCLSAVRTQSIYVSSRRCHLPYLADDKIAWGRDVQSCWSCYTANTSFTFSWCLSLIWHFCKGKISNTRRICLWVLTSFMFTGETDQLQTRKFPWGRRVNFQNMSKLNGKCDCLWHRNYPLLNVIELTLSISRHKS